MQKKHFVLSLFFFVFCTMFAGFFASSKASVANAVDIPDKGGAMYVASESTLDLSNVGINKYNAQTQGGGIFLETNSKLTMNNVIIDSCASTREGHGIYVSSGANVTMTNSNITQNYAPNYDEKYNGGGIYLEPNSTFTMNSGLVGRNNGFWGGGAYISSGAKFIMNGGEFSENCSTDGMSDHFYVNDGELTINGGQVGSDYDQGTKYAIYMSGGTLNLSKGSVYGNIYNDGVIDVSAGFTITNGKIDCIDHAYLNCTLSDISELDGWSLPINATDFGYGDYIMEFRGQLEAGQGSGQGVDRVCDDILEWAQNNITVPSDAELQVLYAGDEDFEEVYQVFVNTKGVPIYFNANGGTCSVSSKSVRNGETFGTLPTATRDGYTFAGWWTASSGGTQITSSTTSSFTSSQTLFAHWTPIVYTLTLNPNGGEFNDGTTTKTLYYKYDTGVYSDSACTTRVTSLPIPIKAGYVLTRYVSVNTYKTISDESGSMSSTNISALKESCLSGDTTYKAWYDEAIYTMTLDHNYADTSTTYNTLYVKYGSDGGVYVDSSLSTSAKITKITAPTKLGYTFGGYYFGSTQIINSSGSINSSATLTNFGILNPKIVAKWTLISDIQVINETKKLVYYKITSVGEPPDVGGVFSSLRNAISAASSGDILRITDDINEAYISGKLQGASEYENLSIAKNITIYGSQFKDVSIAMRGSIVTTSSYSLTIEGSNHRIALNFQSSSNNDITSKNLRLTNVDTAGAIYLSTSSSNAYLSNCHIENNLYLISVSTSCSLSDGTIIDGDARLTASGATLYIHDATINNSGGTAVTITHGGKLSTSIGAVINGLVSVNNSMYNNMITLALSGGKIVNKYASEQNGSGIMIYANSQVTLSCSMTFDVYGKSIYIIGNLKSFIFLSVANSISISIPTYTTASNVYFGLNDDAGITGYVSFYTRDSSQIGGYSNQAVVMTSTQDQFNVYSSHFYFYDYNENDILNDFSQDGSELAISDHEWYLNFGCFDINSDILVWDDKKKRIVRKKAKDIKYTDKLLVWNFDKGCLDFAEPLFIQKHITVGHYSEIKFSDGTIWKLGGEHSVFSLDHNDFRAIVSSNPEYGCPIGTRVINSDGKVLTIVSKRTVYKPLTHTNIFTNYHMNIYINGILSSTPMNNMYEIKDMKFIKKGEHCETRELLEGIDEKYIKGMRLEEYTDERIKFILKVNPQVSTLKEFIDNKAGLNK